MGNCHGNFDITYDHEVEVYRAFATECFRDENPSSKHRNVNIQVDIQKFMERKVSGI